MNRTALNNKQNQIVIANLLAIGTAILNEVSGNGFSSKTTGTQVDASRVLAVRMKSNLSKLKGGQND